MPRLVRGQRHRDDEANHQLHGSALPLRWGLIAVAGVSCGLAAGATAGPIAGLTVGLAVATFLHRVLARR